MLMLRPSQAEGSPAVEDSAPASGIWPESGGQSASLQLGDSNMLHGEEAPKTPAEHGQKHDTEHDVEGGVQKRTHVDDASLQHGNL